MADDAQERQAASLSLEEAQVLVLEAGDGGKSQTKDRLIDIGVRQISSCASLIQLTESLASETPDLLLIDLDSERAAVCETIQKIRLGKVETKNPFVVIIALVARPDRDVVEAALQAGADDLIVKPVTNRSLRDRVNRQIEERKDFIATEDYVGPDRRPEDREPSDEDLVAIEVPNSLRHVVTGDESAALNEDRIKETMHALSAQKFFHLSRKIDSLAAGAESVLSKGVDFPLLGGCVETISASLDEIEAIMSDQDFSGVAEVVASAREALACLQEAGEGITARHFSLLKVHGQSITATLKESEAASGVLVTELERAVRSLAAPDAEAPAPAAEEKASDETEEEAEAQGPVEEPAPQEPAAEEPSEPAKQEKLPFKIRFLAWWEGVEPSEILAPANAEAKQAD